MSRIKIDVFIFVSEEIDWIVEGTDWTTFKQLRCKTEDMVILG